MKAVAAARRLYATCPSHGVRFAVSGQDGPIKCDVAPHLITNNYPASSTDFVELCTNCDTLWRFSPQSPATQCAHCGVSFGERSLCDQCSVFTLAPSGVTLVNCAGCGARRQNEHAHHCAEVGMFSTPREECPFCLDTLMPLRPVEVLDPGKSDGLEPLGEPGGPGHMPGPVDPLAGDIPGGERPRVLRDRRSRIWIGAAIVIISVSVLAYLSGNSFPSRVDRALAAHRYFEPAGESLYDIYKTEASKHPESAELKAAATKIIVALQPEADDHLASFYRDSDPTDWTRMARLYEFLEMLSPTDASIKTKHAYAEGQHFLVDGRDYSRAFDSFRRALSFDGRFVLAINGIAKVYIQDSSPLRNEAAALRSYQDAMAADPNFTWAPKNLGEYYMQREQWESAELYMARALQTSPERPSILAAMGRIAYNRHNYAAARDYYRHALQVAKKPEDIQRYNHALQQISEKL